jgi:hypothetical protein
LRSDRAPTSHTADAGPDGKPDLNAHGCQHKDSYAGRSMRCDVRIEEDVLASDWRRSYLPSRMNSQIGVAHRPGRALQIATTLAPVMRGAASGVGQ